MRVLNGVKLSGYLFGVDLALTLQVSLRTSLFQRKGEVSREAPECEKGWSGVCDVE